MSAVRGRPEPDWTVEIAAPDIRPYRTGNTGIDYATTWDSGRPGPHALITALVHGNELCGAHALDFLFRHEVRPAAGRLSLAFVNTAAYAQFDPRYPGASRFVDEDLNRLWDEATLDGPRHSTELDRARELRPLVDRADLLLDVHSMQKPNPPLMLAGALAKGRNLARALGIPETIVCDEGHAAGRRLRDYSFFGDPADARAALLVECGQHWQQTSVDVAIATTLAFLVHAGMMTRDAALALGLPADPPPQGVIEITHAVTVETDRFTFVAPFQGMERIAHAGTVLGHDGDTPVSTPYDDCVLIMPSRRLTAGQTAVRLGRYVAGGA